MTRCPQESCWQESLAHSAPKGTDPSSHLRDGREGEGRLPTGLLMADRFGPMKRHEEMAELEILRGLTVDSAKAIHEISKDIIYLVPTGSKMEKAAKKLNMKIACEIFADRNYEDDGNLVSRKKPHALITDPEQAKKHVLSMVKNQSLNCHSGKQIPCEIDSVCIHGDNESSLATARSIRLNLIENGLNLKPLNAMEKFI